MDLGLADRSSVITGGNSDTRMPRIIGPAGES